MFFKSGEGAATSVVLDGNSYVFVPFGSRNLNLIRKIWLARTLDQKLKTNTMGVIKPKWVQIFVESGAGQVSQRTGLLWLEASRLKDSTQLTRELSNPNQMEQALLSFNFLLGNTNLDMSHYGQSTNGITRVADYSEAFPPFLLYPHFMDPNSSQRSGMPLLGSFLPQSIPDRILKNQNAVDEFSSQYRDLGLLSSSEVLGLLGRMQILLIHREIERAQDPMGRERR